MYLKSHKTRKLVRNHALAVALHCNLFNNIYLSFLITESRQSPKTEVFRCHGPSYYRYFHGLSKSHKILPVYALKTVLSNGIFGLKYCLRALSEH